MDWEILYPGIVVVLIVLLVYLEFTEHDAFAAHPEYGAKRDMYLQVSKRIDALRDYTSWRRALITALVATVFSTIILFSRFPNKYEWLVFGAIVFVVAYLTDSWFKYHYIYYNSQVIETELKTLVE